MDFFKSKTTTDLSNLHNQVFSQSSKSTKTTFLQSMKRIEKIYGESLPKIGLRFVCNSSDFLKMLDESSYAENTKLTTITNILKLLKIIDAPLITYNHWLTILKDMSEARQTESKNQLKEKLKVLMNFKDIRQAVLDKVDKYEKNDSIAADEYKDFLIVALFSLQIPVRESNYVNMKVVDNESFMDDKSNYLLVNDDSYKMIFNKYRTSHIIGKKTVNIANENIKFLLDKWLSVPGYNTNSSNLFIVSDKNRRAMNAKQIGDSFKSGTKLLFGSELTISNLRSSYMKYIKELDPDLEDKLEIASILGYSTCQVIDNH